MTTKQGSPIVGPKSLLELATAAVIKNIKTLESIGDYLPYDSVKHILGKVESAYQLRRIELNSPHIQGETGELWLKLIERDFPLEYKAKAYKPQNPSKWYRVWEKYKTDHDQSIEESEAKLREAMAGLRQHKAENTSKIVERKYLPRETGMRKKQALGPRMVNNSTLTFGGGSRTSTKTGSSVMRKVRREVREIRTIHGSLSRPIRGPSQQRVLSKAPPAMVNDKRIASQPSYKPIPKPTHSEPSSVVTAHEQRAAFISDSESDGEFDEEARRAPAPKPTQPVRRPITKPRAAGGSALQRKFGGSSITPSVSIKSPVKVSSPASANREGSDSHDSASRMRQQGSPKAPSKATSYLPRQASPPEEDDMSPPQNLGPAPGAIRRKRKAVDVFMRPKKKTA